MFSKSLKIKVDHICKYNYQNLIIFLLKYVNNFNTFNSK